MQYLLDTHVWLWFVLGDKSLSTPNAKIIESAIGKNAVYVSAISGWEVAMLAKRERIAINQPSLTWIKKALEGIEYLNLSPEVSTDSCALPGNFHADPADKIIVATARLNNLVLLTRDKKILDYALEGYVSAKKV
jgi:PIN domain nuclease of toxin-antitoxin system